MAKSKTVRVYPDGNVWVVKRDGVGKAAAIRDTKKEALEVAREIALNQGISITIHGRDGKIQRRVWPNEEPDEDVMKKPKFWEAHSGSHFNARQKFMLNKLLDHFDGKLTSSKWAKMAKCSHDIALRDIQDLVSQSVLAKDPAGGRSTNYLLRELG